MKLFKKKTKQQTRKGTGLAEAGVIWMGQFLTRDRIVTGQFRAILHPGEIKTSWPARSIISSEGQRG